jgi:hypothetical protein
MKALIPISLVLMLLGAVMLLADVGASAAWLAMIAVGIALVVVSQRHARLMHK